MVEPPRGFRLRTNEGKHIRFAARVFKSSYFRTIKIPPFPKRFGIVDAMMM